MIAGYEESYTDVTDKLFDVVSAPVKEKILTAKIEGLMEAPAAEAVSGVLARYGRTVGDFLNDEGKMVKSAAELLGKADKSGQDVQPGLF